MRVQRIVLAISVLLFAGALMVSSAVANDGSDVHMRANGKVIQSNKHRVTVAYDSIDVLTPQNGKEQTVPIKKLRVKYRTHKNVPAPKIGTQVHEDFDHSFGKKSPHLKRIRKFVKHAIVHAAKGRKGEYPFKA